MKRALLGLTLAATLTVASAAQTKLSVYDDGFSCPGGCDAHVVFDSRMNGTAYARAPGSSNTKCARGELCEICFDGNSQSCMSVMYRGSGPPNLTFDFTPAFYHQSCGKSDVPAQLRQQCALLEKQATVWLGRINCIKQPQESGCVDNIKTALAAQKTDREQYLLCVKEGERAYNKRVKAGQRRSNECAYELTGTGGSNTKKWKRLLPGACPDGSFVGRDGLDCCSGNAATDRFFGRAECAGFYIPKP